ncbi:MAG: transporter [Dehalococcoidia bacterium]|nr:transporter [Dehalococcoidia bacterium]|tara:strand:- start:12148 stop:12855 length:708 start_codon:yes stop_codon:yes gene_type:complete
MKFSGTFIIIVALFITVLITSNIVAVKLIHILTLPEPFLGDALIFLPASIIIFPISYIIGDVLTEVYGFRTARGVIWLGFACNVLVAIVLWLTGIIPAVIFWENQDAYMSILGQFPLILMGSFVAYLIGEFSNSATLSILKVTTNGKYLWLRTIGSTVVGQGFDSFVFIFIAFGISGALGPETLFRTALLQWWVKIGYEALATPLTYAVVNYIKKKEQMDVYDPPRSLNPFGVFR